MNELSMIFHRMGLNTKDVLDAAGTKWNFHKYSPGLVGGHCIPVDPYYLVQKANEVGYHSKVITAGRSINDNMPAYVAQLTVKAMIAAGQTIKGANVLIMGLTYKENVDDVRESPTLQLLECQERHLARPLKVYDPFCKKDIVKNQFHDLDTFLSEVDLVVIMVKHDEIKQNWDKLRGKVVLDCHNICPLEGVYHL